MAGIIIAGWDPQEGGQVRHSHPQNAGAMPFGLSPPQPFSSSFSGLSITYY